MMTSNRPLKEWGKLIGDAPAAAILTIAGRSYRLKGRSTQTPAKTAKPGVGKKTSGSKQKKTCPLLDTIISFIRNYEQYLFKVVQMPRETNLMVRVGLILRSRRQPFWKDYDYWLRYSTRNGKPDGSLFFRTQGCRHDHAGGCSMCDYSGGPPTTSSHMIEAVRSALAELPAGIDHLTTSPSGSFLDPWEVPAEARDGILDLIAATTIPNLSFETRAETLTNEALDVCRTVLADRCLNVYVGLESSDPWVSNFAINKQMQPGAFHEGISRLGQRLMLSSANVLIGAPFLSPLEVVEDTVATVNFALDAGATRCCLFPTHVKQWTVVGWLYEQGLYTPPSLWSLIEVLCRLGESIVKSRIEIAWYTSYGAFNVVASPTTCPRCIDDVSRCLDAFAATSDFSFIRRSVAIDCSCRNAWQQSLESHPPCQRVEAATNAYGLMAAALLPQAWWKRHRSRIITELAG